MNLKCLETNNILKITKYKKEFEIIITSNEGLKYICINEEQATDLIEYIKKQIENEVK